MQKKPCSRCTTETPLNQLFKVSDSILCETCGNLRFSELKGQGFSPEVIRFVDPTVCVKCNMDNGGSELAKVGGLPYCPACTQPLYDRDYPSWLKQSMVGLLVLLAFALYHSIPYFRAERELLLGEKLLDARKYQEAAIHLQAALAVGPESEKAMLLTSKAYLLSGDPDSASKALNGRTHFESNALTTEVGALWDRVNDAEKMAGDAVKLDKDHKSAEALKLMQQAAKKYPESPDIQAYAQGIEAGMAFDAKDYPRFLALSEEASKQNPSSSIQTAGVASALAAMYASTGDEAYKQRAEQALEKAKSQLHSDEERKSFEEYKERIEYRLKSRVIIDKSEYDKRFRPQAQDKK